VLGAAVKQRSKGEVVDVGADAESTPPSLDRYSAVLSRDFALSRGLSHHPKNESADLAPINHELNGLHRILIFVRICYQHLYHHVPNRAHNCYWGCRQKLPRQTRQRDPQGVHTASVPSRPHDDELNVTSRGKRVLCTD